jgi:hypothetical protein
MFPKIPVRPIKIAHVPANVLKVKEILTGKQLAGAVGPSVQVNLRVNTFSVPLQSILEETKLTFFPLEIV